MRDYLGPINDCCFRVWIVRLFGNLCLLWVVGVWRGFLRNRGI